MRNISSIKNCYGCGVCTLACSKNIIDIKLNKNGFYEPYITDPDKCTNCGLCLDVCAHNHSDLAPIKRDIKSYGAWSNDQQILQKCSSGGIGFEIGKQLLEQGYKACGVRYNPDSQRAEHYMASTVEEFIPSIGSKYIQSFTVDGFKSIDKKSKYLITGTPCQIDSLRRYIQKFKIEDNFVLLDFFCHSVPSMIAWNRYIQLVERTTGKVTYASWRNKKTGWHDSWAMGMNGENDSCNDNTDNSFNSLIKEKETTYYSRLSTGDVFYKLFLGDFCCNPACHDTCKYKNSASSADIRIGDFWGNTYKNNEDGVSTLVTYTERGDQIIKSLNNVTLVNHPFEVVTECQMKKNANRAKLASVAKFMLNKNINYKPLWKILFRLEFLLQLPKRVIDKLKRTLKR